MAKVIIKKYPNRRLYNTQISSYISLNDLLELIKDGIDFQVIDSKNDSDITKSTLIQIIIEQESKSYNLMPTHLLKQIIGFHDSNQKSIFTNYHENLMKCFNQHQETTGSSINIFNELNQNNMKFFEDSIKMFYNSIKMEGKPNE